MEARDQEAAANKVVRILRRATRTVQVAPFIYLLLYSVYMICGSFLPDPVVSAADTALLLSPVTTGGMLAASKLFKLCRWHKAACLIPSASQIEGCVDTFVFQFTEIEITIINISLGIVAIIFFISAYRHFFVNGRKAHTL